jgi:2-polyprenyl-6-methoxyphenol hydroxylase-like FAD-dependent oxidoreductase
MMLSQITTKFSMTTPKLPVVIAGAGPCGLVAAITLQKEGVRFVIVEGTARERLCSNVGSGFDLAPTAIDILKN